MPDSKMYCFISAWVKPRRGTGEYRKMSTSLYSNTFYFIRGVKIYTQITKINCYDKANALGTQSLTVTADLEH